jgi:hypothetical protein
MVEPQKPVSTCGEQQSRATVTRNAHTTHVDCFNWIGIGNISCFNRIQNNRNVSPAWSVRDVQAEGACNTKHDARTASVVVLTRCVTYFSASGLWQALDAYAWKLLLPTNKGRTLLRQEQDIVSHHEHRSWTLIFWALHAEPEYWQNRLSSESLNW